MPAECFEMLKTVSGQSSAWALTGHRFQDLAAATGGACGDLAAGPDVYHKMPYYTCMHSDGSPMRTNIEIDDALMAEAEKASGQATRKQTVEQALRLIIVGDLMLCEVLHDAQML